MHLFRDDHFREWKTAEKRLCAQRASPDRAETPRSIDELRANVRGNVADMTKEMKEFLEKHGKDFAVAPERRGLDISRTPIMTRARTQLIRDGLIEMHREIQKLKGAELAKRAEEFRALLTELNGQFSDVGMELLYTLNGDNAEQFDFMRIRFHYGNHYEYHIEQRRNQLPRRLPVPPELEDQQEPGLRNDVLRQQTAFRVGRIREQVATLEQARDYVNRDPENHMQVQRAKIMEHYRTKAQKPPEYAIDVTPPSLADVEELGWALSAMNVEDTLEASRAISTLKDDFLKMGIVMEVNTRDAVAANALVGQRRYAPPPTPGRSHVWEKVAANKWTCPLRPGVEWTDTQMAQNTLGILNPRFEVKFRKLSVRDDVNEVEAEIRELQAREEIAKQMESSARRDSTEYYQAVSARYGAARGARLLREYNDSLKLPDERVLRHRAEEVKKLVEAGYDEQEKPVTDLMADINTRFERMQAAGKGDEARAILDRASVKDGLLTNGLRFEEFRVGESAVKSVRLSQPDNLNAVTPRSRRNLILRRRGDMQAFRDLTGALLRYLEASRRDGNDSTTARAALDEEHKASTAVSERYKAITDVAEKTLFEDRLGRLLGEAGYDYRGFNRFGDLTFEYRGRY